MFRSRQHIQEVSVFSSKVSCRLSFVGPFPLKLVLRFLLEDNFSSMINYSQSKCKPFITFLSGELGTSYQEKKERESVYH